MKKKISCPACNGHGFISKFNDCSIWSENALNVMELARLKFQ